ncbi:MAG: GIY-YIG nuclease family protein [Desulfobacteraceae bacterium]|nr:GIY-YIG nuclease family protein [Desulfobacteraceae bacterium]
MNIETDNQLNKVFNKPPMIAYKQPPQSNLRQILVKSTLPDREQRVLPGLKPCNTQTCNICPYIHPTSTTQSSNNSTITISINCEATCDTKNVVYCITCSHCKIQYIGETGRTLRARISEHIGYIRMNNNNTTTGQHFQQQNHNMKVTILHVLKYEGETTRKIKEARCINSFDTKTKGLNKY